MNTRPYGLPLDLPTWNNGGGLLLVLLVVLLVAILVTPRRPR